VSGKRSAKDAAPTFIACLKREDVSRVSHLRPDLVVSRFLDIDFEALGRPFLLLDVDNTIAPIQVDEDMLPGVADHIAAARSCGALRDVCLVSNVFVGHRKRLRVERFARALDAHAVMPDVLHLKPHAAPFLEALKHMGATASASVMVGDQLFTDVLGGNRLGMLTVYVRPIGPDHWTTALTMRRSRERRLFAAWGILPS